MQVKLFGSFFINIKEYLSIIKLTDTVISDSIVLYILKNAPVWKPGDLDFYILRVRTISENHVV